MEPSRPELDSEKKKKFLTVRKMQLRSQGIAIGDSENDFLVPRELQKEPVDFKKDLWDEFDEVYREGVLCFDATEISTSGGGGGTAGPVVQPARPASRARPVRRSRRDFISAK